ncbi:YwbE family protein [bacterium]|nr:YwbE family protein [bacterium]
MEQNKLTGSIRSNIQIGSEVEVVQKQNQRSGNLTEGIVKRILTKSPNHPHGIKVQLDSGLVGRVKNVLV